MTRIDSTAQLAALIRTQVKSLRVPARAAQGAQKNPNDKPAASPGNEDIATAVVRRIRAIDPSDPERRRRAFRIFLETVILAELGESLMHDPAFPEVVEKVHKLMEVDPSIKEMMEKASDLLLTSAC